MEYVGTLVINERTIICSGMKPIGKHEGLIMPRLQHPLIIFSIRLNLTQVVGPAEAMLQIRGCHKSGQAFVEPKVIPIASSYHDAPPLVGQFVSAEPHVV